MNAFGRFKLGMTAQRAEASFQPFFHGMLEMEVKAPAFRNPTPEVRERFLKILFKCCRVRMGRSCGASSPRRSGC